MGRVSQAAPHFHWIQPVDEFDVKTLISWQNPQLFNIYKP
jgi:hypothetical protein